MKASLRWTTLLANGDHKTSDTSEAGIDMTDIEELRFALNTMLDNMVTYDEEIGVYGHMVTFEVIRDGN